MKPSALLTKGILTATTFLAGAGIEEVASAAPFNPAPMVAKDPDTPKTPPAPMVAKDPEIEARQKEARDLIDVLKEETAKRFGSPDPDDLKKQIKDLASAVFSERDAADKKIQTFGNAAREALREAVKSKDAEVSRRAELLIKILDRRSDIQVNTVNRLGDLAAEAKEAVPLLVEILKGKDNPEFTPEDNPRLKVALVTALGKFGPAANVALPALMDNFSHTNPGLRLAVIKSVGSIVTAKEQATAVPALSKEIRKRVISVLGDALKEEDSRIVVLAAEKLGVLHPYVDQAVARKLGVALKANADLYVKAIIIRTLLYTGTEASVAAPELCAVLREYPQLRYKTAEVLGRMGPKVGTKEVVDTLLTAAHDGDAVTRSYVLEALGNIGAEPDRVVPVLTSALRDKFGFVKTDAARALAKFGVKAETSVDALIITTKDEDLYVRGAAYRALGSVGKRDKRVLPLLTDALNDSNLGVRLDAMTGLGNMGQAAREAIPRLQKIADGKGYFDTHDDEDGADEAIKAINRKIEAPRKKGDPAKGMSWYERMRSPDLSYDVTENTRYQHLAVRDPVKRTRV